MARTIREMAEEYTKMEHGSYKIGAISDFTAGARAVLEEIEKEIGDEYTDNFWLRKLIKELKEE